MSKWRTENATACGHEVHVHEDWDSIPKYCRECKALNDEKWYDGTAQVCGHVQRMCRDWESQPAFCKECRSAYPPEEEFCELCGASFTISTKTKYNCSLKGWNLPKKCHRCRKCVKLIRDAFEGLKNKYPDKRLYLKIEMDHSLVSEIGSAITLSPVAPAGLVSLRGEKFAKITTFPFGSDWSADTILW